MQSSLYAGEALAEHCDWMQSDLSRNVQVLGCGRAMYEVASTSVCGARFTMGRFDAMRWFQSLQPHGEGSKSKGCLSTEIYSFTGCV